MCRNVFAFGLYSKFRDSITAGLYMHLTARVGGHYYVNSPTELWNTGPVCFANSRERFEVGEVM